jgi:predicted DNA-binding transcriptional regulator YafY
VTRRADRLFEIVRVLRRKKAVTGQFVADELGVSVRTVYRDIADLVGSGVPIEGEAGVGYRLAAGFDMPPLMFREDELEALVFGLRMVVGFGDAGLSKSAKRAFDRIAHVLPASLKRTLDSVRLFAPGFAVPESMRAHLPTLRRAIADQTSIDVTYKRKDDQVSERRIRPLGLAFFGHSWALVGWCELRRDFRTFRLDRIERLAVTPERFEQEAGRTLDDFFAEEGVVNAGSLE